MPVGPTNAWHFVARLASCSQNTQKIMLYSYSNDAAYVACSSGFSTTVNTGDWEQVGVLSSGSLSWKRTKIADYPEQACYSAVVEITGLSPNTRYTWSAYQDNDPKGKNWGIEFYTLPEIGDTEDFGFATLTCNNLLSGTDALLEYILDSPGIRFIIFQDDLLYVDSRSPVNWDGSDPVVTNHLFTQLTPEAAQDEHTYAVGWMRLYGMIDEESTPGTAWEEIWQRIPMFEMWGDHELTNNWRNHVDAPHDSVYYHVGRPVYDAMVGKGAPDPYKSGTFTLSGNESDDRDTGGAEEVAYPHMYFGVRAGNLSWFQMDRNSYSCTNSSYATSAGIDVQLMGPAQNSDALTFLGSALTDFKMFVSSNTFARAASSGGGQEAWLENWPTDWQTFADGIINSSELNGTDGSLVYYRGNDHNSQLFRHLIDGGSIPLFEFVAGPCTHIENHTAVSPKSTYNDVTNIYSRSAVSGNPPSAHQGIVHWTVGERLTGSIITELEAVGFSAVMDVGGNEFVGLPENSNMPDFTIGLKIETETTQNATNSVYNHSSNRDTPYLANGSEIVDTIGSHWRDEAGTDITLGVYEFNTSTDEPTDQVISVAGVASATYPGTGDIPETTTAVRQRLEYGKYYVSAVSGEGTGTNTGIRAIEINSIPEPTDRMRRNSAGVADPFGGNGSINMRGSVFATGSFEPPSRATAYPSRTDSLGVVSSFNLVTGIEGITHPDSTVEVINAPTGALVSDPTDVTALLVEEGSWLTKVVATNPNGGSTTFAFVWQVGNGGSLIGAGSSRSIVQRGIRG